MSSPSSLANDIEDELRAKNLSNFVLRKESKVEELYIEVYENQSWHPVLQTWGSVVGVHLNAVLDRSPFTDETGTRVLRYEGMPVSSKSAVCLPGHYFVLHF